MIKSLAKSRVALVIEKLESQLHFVGSMKEMKTDQVKLFIADAKELIEYNEWRVALENLLENLYEVDYKIDIKTYNLIKEAIIKNKMNIQDWSFIDELLIPPPGIKH